MINLNEQFQLAAWLLRKATYDDIIVDQVDPGFEDPVEAFHVLWFTGAAKVLEVYGTDALGEIDPGLRAGISRQSRS